MFDILQGDMTRSKVILTFTCLKMYIARSGDTSGSRTTLFSFFPPTPIVGGAAMLTGAVERIIDFRGYVSTSLRFTYLSLL